MEYNIDQFKILNNKLYINGWAHYNNYKIEVESSGEKKMLENYVSRYDINVVFHEKIDDNQYGFKQELEFSKKIKIAKVFIVTNKERLLIKSFDNRKYIQIMYKIKKVLGKIKRGVKFLWREYHFIIPPTMLKKYIKDAFRKNRNEPIYNPEIISEYNEWLEKQVYSDVNNEKRVFVISNDNSDFSDININSKSNISKILNEVKEKYVCLVNGNLKFVDKFYCEINEELDKDYDLIYYDNDKVVNEKFCNPIFKPDWSRDTLMGVNYIGNSFIIKKSILLDLKCNNYNLYEILLNLLDKNIKVKHISKILYHDYGYVDNGYNQLKKYIKKNNIDAVIKKNSDGLTNTVVYKNESNPLISIIIPTKDHADILDVCLQSIYKKTKYKNYEIIVIDNNSEDEETFKLLRKYNKNNNFRYKRIECEFNYSYLNNEAVKLSKGDYVLLLNNDIEIISPDWLDIMLGYASQNHVGAVGAKLLFEDNTIQHAGIIMGKGGLAGHAHYGKKKDYISPQYELKIPYDYCACTAACLMVSKQKFLEVNGLEEKLKVAFNDVDFNLKLLDKGYNNVFLPNVLLYHYESKSRGLDTTPEKQKRFVQEWSYIIDKWYIYVKHDPYYNDNFSKNIDYMLK